MCWSTKQKRREGAVLLIVLGIILLASWMIVQIIGRVSQEVALRGEDRQNDAIQACAFQSLEIVIGVLQEIKTLDGALYSPTQGWEQPLAYAGFKSVTATNVDDEVEQEIETLDDFAPMEFPPGVDVEVVVIDESGRLPINQTSEERWKLLFDEMGIQSADAEVLTDCLLDWIDRDKQTRLNGAEAAVYQQREPAYKPSNAPIEDLLELRYIEGFDRIFFDERGVPNELFHTFKSCVTVNDSSDINFNTAPSFVLNVLAEEMDVEARAITDYLWGVDLEPGTADDRILRPGQDDPDVPTNNDGNPIDFSATCRYLTVHITSKSAGTAFNLSARLDLETPSPGGIYPMTILDLQTKGSTL